MVMFGYDRLFVCSFSWLGLVGWLYGLGLLLLLLLVVVVAVVVAASVVVVAVVVVVVVLLLLLLLLLLLIIIIIITYSVVSFKIAVSELYIQIEFKCCLFFNILVLSFVC